MTRASERVSSSQTLGKPIWALGNRQGPHALASEWVGTRLADWFGLQTFDYGVLNLDEIDEIPLPRGHIARPGPAFVSRAEDGNTWGGGAAELDRLINPNDISRLVVFDTWTRNCDRHPPDLATRRPNRDNVFLSVEGVPTGRSRLVAMDHTHCFTCGRDLDARLAGIDLVRDSRIYGLFPEFVSRMSRDEVVAACARLRACERIVVERIVASIPTEWEVNLPARAALLDLVVERARFVADTIDGALAPTCWPPIDGDLF